jgi:hypothetical protein
MTVEQCERCKHADRVGGFPDGEDMFVCSKESDPGMPFDCCEFIPCPFFEEEDE